MAEALYRKYRPQVFEDVVGQEPIERTLKNAIEQDKVSHAYLFCGPRGTGKTTTARLLAKALLCSNGPTPNPDGTCEDCQLIADGEHPDVYELDAASRTGVENVREEIISRVQFAPTRGRSKIYIIDEVHMLSTAAFNALLKTLEEPPSHVVFILCTTDPQKVPETIHSRCQRFDFRRIAPESMVSRLGAICMAEGVTFEGEALDLIAHRAEGGLRNALTSLEQIIAFENGSVTLAGAERLLGGIDSNDLAQIVALIGQRDIANCFRWTADYVETGADLAQFVRDMAEHIRNLYVMALVGDDAHLEVSDTTRRELASELQWFGPDRASRLLGVLGDLSTELKTSSNPRLSFEIALTRMVRPDSDLTIEALAERVEALESGYSAVAHVLPGAHTQAAVANAPGQPMPVQQAETAPSPAPRADTADTGASHAPRPADSEAPQRPVAAPAEPPMAATSPAPTDAADGFAAKAPKREAVAQNAVGNAPSSASEAGQAAPPATSPRGAGNAAALLENPASLQRLWQAALAAVKKHKQAYGVLFMGTKARYDSNAGLLKIVFPAESAFAFNTVQKPDVADTLSEALSRAAGMQIPFAYEQAGSSVAMGGGNAAQASAPAPVQTAQAAVGTQDGLPATASQATPTPQSDSDRQVHQAEPVAQAAPATRVAEPQAQAAPPAYDDVPYEEVPYEEVPYEDVPYEQVPYEDEYFAPSFPPEQFGNVREATPTNLPNTQGATSPQPANQAIREQTPAAAPSPAPAAGGDIAPDDIQAMLQAGFGAGVVLSEVQE